MIRRPRRLRVTKQIRDLVHETSIDKTDLIYPMFIIDGETEDIPSMPNIKRYSLTDLPSALDEVVSAGVGAVLYFGIPKTKDEFGSEAYNEFGIVQRAIRLTKELYPDLIVIADICLCEYTSHGQHSHRLQRYIFFRVYSALSETSVFLQPLCSLDRVVGYKHFCTGTFHCGKAFKDD